MKKRSTLVAIGFIVTRVVAWTLGSASLLVLALLLALSSAPGRRALLRVGLWAANRAVQGHVSVRALEGNVLDRLVLLDARLEDSEGQEIVDARRVEVDLDWRALLHERIHVRDLRMDATRLTLRHLQDNRLNLAALGKPSPPGAKKPKDDAGKKPSPLRVELDHFKLQIDGAYHPPRGHEGNPLNWPRGTFDIEGGMKMAGGEVKIDVFRLVSDSRDPLQAHVELRGELTITPHKLPNGGALMTFGDVALTVESDGREIARLMPGLKTLGRWQVRVTGGGPLTGLRAHVIISAPAGNLTAEGGLAVLYPGVRWNAILSGDGLDPAAIWSGAPAGKLQLSLRGQGAPDGGEVIVERLRAALAGVRLDAHGQSDFAGHGTGAMTASIDSLTRLTPLGVLPPELRQLDGAVAVEATLARDAKGPRVAGTARLSRLKLRQAATSVTLRSAVAHGSWAAGKPATVTLDGRGLDVQKSQKPQLALATLAVALHGLPARFGGSIAAVLGDGTSLRTTLNGGVAGHAADLRVETVTVDSPASRGGRHFALPSPLVLHATGTPQDSRLTARFAGAILAAHSTLNQGELGSQFTLDVPDAAPLGRIAGAAVVTGKLHASGTVQAGAALKLDVDVTGDGLAGLGASIDEVRLHLSSVDLHGQARVDLTGLAAGERKLATLSLRADGEPDHMRVTLDGVAPDGSTRLRGEIDGRWQTHGLHVDSADLAFRTLDLDLPRQAWKLVKPARLTVDGRNGVLRGFQLRSGMGEVDLDGSWRNGVLDATVSLHDGDLVELARVLGKPGILPAARWSGKLHLAGTVASPLVEAQLEARAADTVVWYGVAFNVLSLTAYADSTHVQLHADAHGRNDSRITIDAHGAPRRDAVDPSRFVALAASIDKLRVSAHGRTWDVLEPCLLDVGSASRITVDHCRIGSGRAEIGVKGSAPLTPAAAPGIDLTLSTRHLNLRDLGDLAAPGHKQQPLTDFNIQAQVTGTKAAPIVDLAVSGKGAQVDEGIPENVNYNIRAHYQDKRVHGSASMRQVGLSLGVGATFDVPITLEGPDQPIALQLEARPVPFFKIRDSLPPAIANVKGFFTLRLTASGTTHHPQLRGEIHMPSWQLDDLKDNDTVVDFVYRDGWLKVNSETSFNATSLVGAILRIQPQRNSGTVSVELRAPLDLFKLVTSPHQAVHALMHDAPLTGSAELRRLDLTKVPLQTIGIAAPLNGTFDGSIHLEGTLHRPRLNAQLAAKGLTRIGSFDRADLQASLELANGRLHVAGGAAVRGAPLATFKGEAELDAQRLVDDEGWQRGKLDIDFAVPGYALSRLHDLQPRLHAIEGWLHGAGTIRGTWGAPDVKLAGRIDKLMLAGARFTHVVGDARYLARRWRFGVNAAADGNAGRLRASGDVAADETAPLDVQVDANDLDVRFLAALWEQIGEVGGTAQAHVAIAGTRADPQPSGTLALTDGRFAFRRDPRHYKGALSLRVDGQAATLTELTVRGDDGGSLVASGRAQLQGLKATEMTMSAKAQRFTVGLGSAQARLDADFTLSGDRTDNRFHGRLDIHRGTIVLPELPGGDSALPMGELADVSYKDSRSQHSAMQRQTGQGAFIVTKIEGPLQLRGREADLDLVGELGVTVAGGALGLEGVVESTRGSIELLGHRYVVERGQLAFAGAVNDPELHLRASRRIGAVTIAVVIEGTAQHPDVRLSADPPVYDQTQLVSLVLAGRTGEDRVAVGELNRQITGLLSAVVIQKIEQQVAPTLPIDVVRPLDQQSYAELSQSPLEVGRYVTDRIYVSYEHRFGSRMGRSEANANEARAEYKLGSKGHWQLDTTFGDGGVGGIYIFWSTKR